MVLILCIEYFTFTFPQSEGKGKVLFWVNYFFQAPRRTFYKLENNFQRFLLGNFISNFFTRSSVGLARQETGHLPYTASKPISCMRRYSVR